MILSEVNLNRNGDKLMDLYYGFKISLDPQLFSCDVIVFNPKISESYIETSIYRGKGTPNDK